MAGYSLFVKDVDINQKKQLKFNAMKYEVVSMGKTILGNDEATFSRVRHRDGMIQFNAAHFDRLTKQEIVASVLWCDQRAKDFDSPESIIDKRTFVVCKKKGIEKDFLSVMLKQGMHTPSNAFKKRVELIEKYVKNGKI